MQKKIIYKNIYRAFSLKNLLIAFILLIIGFFLLLNNLAITGLTVLEKPYRNREFKLLNTENILKGQKRVFEFTSKEDNLGIVAVRFNTNKKINHDIITFRLKEKNANNWYVINEYTTEQFQTEKLFTFGFPVIKNSAGKKYIVELLSQKGSIDNSVAVSTLDPVMVAKHQFEKSSLITDKSLFSHFLIIKMQSFLTDPIFLLFFILYFLPFTVYIYYILFTKKSLVQGKKFSAFLDDFFLLHKNRAFPELDGIRAWAITMVYFAHTWPWLLSMSAQTGGTSKLLISSVLNVVAYMPFIGAAGGGAGVDLFFVLSGFLIYMSIHRRPPAFVDFMLKRFKRLLPVHLLLIAGLLATLSLPVMLANIFFFADLFPRIANVNLVTWTLTYEMLFYLICALWYISGRNISFLHTWRFFFLAVILIYASQWILFTPLKIINIKYPDMSRFIAFFFGIALAKLYFHDKKRWIKLERMYKYSAVFGLLIIVLFKYSWDKVILKQQFGQAGVNLAFLIFDIGIFLFVSSLLVSKEHLLKKILSNKYLRIIGVVSYSMYLFHYNWGLHIGKSIVQDVYFTPIMMVLFVIVGFIVSLLFAVILYHYLEKPYFMSSKSQVPMITK